MLAGSFTYVRQRNANPSNSRRYHSSHCHQISLLLHIRKSQKFRRHVDSLTPSSRGACRRPATGLVAKIGATTTDDVNPSHSWQTARQRIARVLLASTIRPDFPVHPGWVALGAGEGTDNVRRDVALGADTGGSAGLRARIHCCRTGPNEHALVRLKSDVPLSKIVDPRNGP
jgi:hypothetical protein